MSPITLTPGTIFATRYRVERWIATGGMGAVYEVTHLETDRRRALKVMHPHLIQSDDMRDRFRREAKVAAQIQSAFIVDVFDAGIDESTKMPFLVMELLQGEELSQCLARVGRFGPEETVNYLWQTALALDKTHRAHIVHRDLKPENLFLHEQEDGPPRIKILDFGIAKLIADASTDGNATRSLGTPLYMAPEQFHSNSSVSPASDIYALGMMAYTMLVGRGYWHEEKSNSQNIFGVIAQLMQGPSEPPSERALRQDVELPPSFDEWFAQATAKKPGERFLSATAAIRGLASALDVAEPGSTTLAMTGGLPKASQPSIPAITESQVTTEPTVRKPKNETLLLPTLPLQAKHARPYTVELTTQKLDRNVAEQARIHAMQTAAQSKNSAHVLGDPEMKTGDQGFSATQKPPESITQPGKAGDALLFNPPPISDKTHDVSRRLPYVLFLIGALFGGFGILAASGKIKSLIAHVDTSPAFSVDSLPIEPAIPEISSSFDPNPPPSAEPSATSPSEKPDAGPAPNDAGVDGGSVAPKASSSSPRNVSPLSTAAHKPGGIFTKHKRDDGTIEIPASPQ